jgi:hypothetical protein
MTFYIGWTQIIIPFNHQTIPRPFFHTSPAFPRKQKSGCPDEPSLSSNETPNKTLGMSKSNRQQDLRPRVGKFVADGNDPKDNADNLSEATGRIFREEVFHASEEAEE